MAKRSNASYKVKDRAKRNPDGVWGIFCKNLESKCHYCRQNLVEPISGKNQTYNTRTFDHLIPASGGGGTTTKNLLETCSACNNTRGTSDYLTFAIFAEFYLRPQVEELGLLTRHNANRLWSTFKNKIPD